MPRPLPAALLALVLPLGPAIASPTVSPAGRGDSGPGHLPRSALPHVPCGGSSSSTRDATPQDAGLRRAMPCPSMKGVTRAAVRRLHCSRSSPSTRRSTGYAPSTSGRPRWSSCATSPGSRSRRSPRCSASRARPFLATGGWRACCSSAPCASTARPGEDGRRSTRRSPAAGLDLRRQLRRSRKAGSVAALAATASLMKAHEEPSSAAPATPLGGRAGGGGAGRWRSARPRV